MEVLKIIAMLCQISTGSSFDTERNQEQCQKYYIECMDKKQPQWVYLQEARILTLPLKQCIKEK